MASIVSQLLDAVSGIFLSALDTDMTVMEEYFPFLSKAFSIMQYTAWALLFLIIVLQLLKAFGGPITEGEHPLQLVARGSLFALLIGFAKPIFEITLEIARAPYTALMEVPMEAEDFSFAGIEDVLMNGITTIVSLASTVGLILLLVLEISLGWNYFKLLLETVERYIVVGVLCYTSPLAYCMGGSKATAQVFKSWCRMVGSQLLLLVMNVWFLRGFSSSVGQFLGDGGALSSGEGNIFLWMFCALAFLKTAQKFDSYLASMGLNVAQTGSSMGMEILMTARALSGLGGSAKSAGSVFHGGSSAAGSSAAASFSAGFASKFKGSSYVRDAVVNGGARMGAGGGLGFVARTFGGIAARNGAVLTGESISSVASRMPNASGSIAGDIADRSLGNYMPQLSGQKLSGTQITGGHISTVATGPDGSSANVELYNTSQFEKPQGAHSLVTASDGSTWYQMASGEGRGALFHTPEFTGSASEADQISAAFPGISEGTTLRTVSEGALEATSDAGSTMWYNSAFFEEPDAPHTSMMDSSGMEWYAMMPNGTVPQFEPGESAAAYNQAAFQEFMPGYEQQITSVDGSQRTEGHFEVRHGDGTGTMFYDIAQYMPPRGDYQVFEDNSGHQWFAIHGEASVERKPVYENGKPVYENGSVKSVNVETVRYRNIPSRYQPPNPVNPNEMKPPKKKN